MTVPKRVSPIGNAAFLAPGGAPANGYKLFTYLAGTTTKTTTWQDASAVASHTNPIILSVLGTAPNPVFITPKQAYKFVLAPPTDTDPPTSPTATYDNVVAIEVSFNINVKDYGAVGDGVTDDYTAFASAVTAAGAGVGDIIHIPKGTYNLSQTLTVTTGITLQGAGQQYTAGADTVSATILRATHSSGDVVRVNGPYVKIRDLNITGNDTRYTGAAGSNYGLRIEATDAASQYCHRFMLERVRVSRQPNHGILLIGNVMSSTLLHVDVDQIKGHGIAINDGTITGRVNKDRPGQVHVLNCRVLSTEGHCIAIGDNTTVTTTSVPYRIFIDNLEILWVASEASKRYQAYGMYILGENIVVQNSAPSGLHPSIAQGQPGSTIVGGIWLSGKNIYLLNNRYIDCLTPIIKIDNYTGFGSFGVTVDGAYINSSEFGTNYYNPAIDIHASAWSVTINIPEEGADVLTVATPGAGGNVIINHNSTLDITRQTTFRGQTSASSFQLQTVAITLADDKAAYISFDSTSRGVCTISGNTSSAKGAMVHFRVGDASNHATVMSSSGSGVVGQTGQLTGTTGTDGNLTIGADSANARLYVENRTGASRAYQFAITAGDGGLFTSITLL